MRRERGHKSPRADISGTHARAPVLQCLAPMPPRKSSDHAPGAPLETRRLQDGTSLLIIPITAAGRIPAARLVVRCEPDGRMFAAISGPRSSSDDLGQ